jgi:hypothetical protein
VANRKTIWGTIALVVLTLAGMGSLYWLIFSVWMMAYPYANHAQWQLRLYTWLAITGFIGMLWCILAIWFFRRKRISS